MHCIEARVDALDQIGLAFARPPELELDLRVLQEPGLELRAMLCQGTQGARMQGGVARVQLETPFLLYFRLSGKVEHRAKIELYYPGAQHEVLPAGYEERFEVEVQSTTECETPATPVEGPETESWLDVYQDPAIRQVFSHIDRYGSISEQDAITMLGGARQMRRFARHFEKHAAKAPFTLRIDTSGGSKTYTKQGRRDL